MTAARSVAGWPGGGAAPRVVEVSTATQESDKDQLLDQAVGLAHQGKGTGGPPRDRVDALLRAYYRHTAAEDLLDRGEVDLYGAFSSHYRTAQHRPQGTAQVRVLTPTPGEVGWSAAGHSVVEVVVDDMPFLVDSLTMELSRQLREVHLVVHPAYDAVRDVAGSLQDLVPVEDGSVAAAEGAVRESWMHVEIDRLRDDDDPDRIAEDVQRVLRDVRESVEDWDKMHDRVEEIVEELGTTPPPTVDEEEVRQARELLAWLADEHFTFLGYREYDLERAQVDGAEQDVLRARPGSGLGVLRDDPDVTRALGRLPEAARARARQPQVLVLAKANSRATVHRPAYLDYVGVKVFDEAGEVVGERRFIGLYSSAAYTESLLRIPLIREKASAVLARSGFDKRSHAGKALMDTLETYPRDELFHTDVDELSPLVEAAMHARERRALRMFVRRDTYGRYVSVLVYLPRDRYNTAVRQKFADLLQTHLRADSVEFTVRINESTTARVHFVVHMAPGETIPDIETTELEHRLAEASRSWRDDFVSAVVTEYGEEVGSRLGRRYADAWPEAYKEDFSPRTASLDLGRLEAIPGDGAGEGGRDLVLHEPIDAAPGEARLKVFRVGEPLSLSHVLPTLSSMGVEVVDERPYELVGLERPTHVYEFGLRHHESLPDDARTLFVDAVRAVWEDRSEIDGFNALVLAAGLDWRRVGVLRAYAKYMRQGQSPFALDYIEEALLAEPGIARLLVRLFEARFDPALGEGDDPDRAERCAELERRIEAALEDVGSLDQDRILRSYLTHVRATLRTSWYQTDDDGRPRAHLALKLEPAAIPDLPEPRPKFEIFVYSPRVEGVHLRFGPVARGGLRWSDRRDDFRTEVLGLVKAQMVKNTVIVPVGAKGGFFAKQLPDPADREAWLAEGQDCYRTFIRGLLAVTDNLVEGASVPPPDVVRHDGDDSYLVVAADKGTATFSDLANDIAVQHGFWLGDAFASGGSVGYDHKAMGITARGAWVAVQRHFRERGIDCQREDVTCVGIGDMSGDVFGNGMLSSEHIRLVAAFDHRHVFLDPDPDAATSFAERQRLFDLSRSSWADYDTSLISEGGGVHARSSKSVPITEQVRRALDLGDDVTAMTPADLISAILAAPVDLLWNGGIGTYVKAAHETHAEVGDKANDAIRVDGRAVRARCVGEGGNLGLTQAGRVEYALRGADGRGGRINTDFIDNSAGVDTSDHEVNIKVLLDRVVAAGDLTRKQRNATLASMTDEVAALVLAHNDAQNLALANATRNAPSLLHVHETWMKRLESRGVLDRELEGLPSRREVRRRLERKGALTTPELAVLLAWTKIVLAEELLGSDVPEDPYFEQDLVDYFPTRIREEHPEAVRAHPLRREIIVTRAVNELVDVAGMTYWPRLEAETGASVPDLVRANFLARDIVGSRALRDDVAALDNRLDAGVQTRMRVEMRTLVERVSRWLVGQSHAPLDTSAVAATFAEAVPRVMERLPELLTGAEQADYEQRRAELEEAGVEGPLASRVAVLGPAYQLLGVVATAEAVGLDAEQVARVHFTLGERLGLPALVERILALPRRDEWETMARAALRDDLHAVHDELTTAVLRETDAEAGAAERIAAWEENRPDTVARATTTLRRICTDDEADLARMSVALRTVRGLRP